MKEFTQAQCHLLFDALFPNGFSAPDIISEIAPMGWEKSPYCTAEHPSIEEAYENSIRIHESLKSLFAGKLPQSQETHESFEEFAKNYDRGEVRPDIELQELIGACVWDIFSDNNDVVKDGKRYDIGSFRGAARFIAERINKVSEKKYDYMDFYMGSFNREESCDLTLVYEFIFKHLKKLGCDWIFHFTQVGIVDFSHLKKQEDTPIENYDPNKALEAELKHKEQQKQLDDFKAKIEEANAQEREDALYKPPPAIVQAYRNIYGKFPLGWVYQ